LICKQADGGWVPRNWYKKAGLKLHKVRRFGIAASEITICLTEDSLTRSVISFDGDLRVRRGGALSQIALGRRVAADRMAAWHGFPAFGFPAKPTRNG